MMRHPRLFTELRRESSRRSAVRALDIVQHFSSIPSEKDLAQHKVCDVVAESLHRMGVTHIYGGHGGAVIPLVSSIVKHPGLTWVYTRNEANASLSAAAYAKLTGRLGVCLATSGPGASNLTTGLIDVREHFTQPLISNFLIPDSLVSLRFASPGRFALSRPTHHPSHRRSKTECRCWR